MKQAREQLDIAKIVAIVSPHNQGSIRVLDRQGTHELFAAKRTYHSQIADAVVPDKPLTVGPGYHLNPEAEENQDG